MAATSEPLIFLSSIVVGGVATSLRTTLQRCNDEDETRSVLIVCGTTTQKFTPIEFAAPCCYEYKAAPSIDAPCPLPDF